MDSTFENATLKKLQIGKKPVYANGKIIGYDDYVIREYEEKVTLQK